MIFDPGHPEVREAVRLALEEDIGAGDITSTLTVPAGRTATGRFIARDSMVLAGVELLPLTMPAELQIERKSGDQLGAGDVIATARGQARLLLERERVSLNFLQRLSGVATLARCFVEAVSGTSAKILDTRKTTPGLRRLEKMAAAAGGVTNHRMGLYDAVLIKNNHIQAAGGVRPALEAARGAVVPVEIEVRTRQELEEALACGAKHLLLDNLTPGEAAEWIRYIAGRATVELSGNITLDTVRAYAGAAPDYISAGSITHSAPAVDINFRIVLDAA